MTESVNYLKVCLLSDSILICLQRSKVVQTQECFQLFECCKRDSGDDFESLILFLIWQCQNYIGNKYFLDVKIFIIFVCCCFEEYLAEWKLYNPGVPDIIWSNLAQMHKILFPDGDYLKACFLMIICPKIRNSLLLNKIKITSLKSFY